MDTGNIYKVTRHSVTDYNRDLVVLGVVTAATLEQAANAAAARWGIYGGLVVTVPTGPVDTAWAAMNAACDASNSARRAGADAATLTALTAAHSDARATWRRARAAAGDAQAGALVAIGAA